MSSGTDQAPLFFLEPTAEVKLDRDYVSRFQEDCPERSPEFPKLLLKRNPALFLVLVGFQQYDFLEEILILFVFFCVSANLAAGDLMLLLYGFCLQEITFLQTHFPKATDHLTADLFVL